MIRNEWEGTAGKKSQCENKSTQMKRDTFKMWIINKREKKAFQSFILNSKNETIHGVKLLTSLNSFQ